MTIKINNEMELYLQCTRTRITEYHTFPSARKGGDQPNLAFQEKQKYYFQTIYSKYSIYKLTKRYTFIPIHWPYHIIAEGELPPLTYA